MKTAKYRDPLECPSCDTALTPEEQDDARQAPGVFLCPCCAKTFTVPKGLRA